jgi:hypothetical protein
MLPRDVVNAFAASGKFVLGLDPGVFGMANALKPHRDELLPRPASRTAVEPIVELALRRTRPSCGAATRPPRTPSAARSA